MRRALFSIIAVTWGLLSSPVGAAPPNDLGWTRYTHDQLGYGLDYPSAIFEARQTGHRSEGKLFVSRDGRAQLMIGALANDSGTLPRIYRDQLLEQSFPGARLDYAPLRRDWFVISGTQGDEMFYQRATFTCGGRIITTWLMIYPKSEQALYNPIVERIHKSHVKSRGVAGSCVLDASQ